MITKSQKKAIQKVGYALGKKLSGKEVKIGKSNYALGVYGDTKGKKRIEVDKYSDAYAAKNMASYKKSQAKRKK